MATLPIRRDSVAAHGVQIDQADARQRLGAELVGVAQQLVAAADGEDDRPAGGGGMHVVALALGQIVGAELLVAVLAAADVVEVGAVGIQRLVEAGRGQLEADAPPLAAALEHDQVAAVGVDVHEVGVQGAHPQHDDQARSITTVLPT